MPDGAVELASGVLQSNQFQFITLIARRSRLIAVVVGGRRHLVNGKITSVVYDIRRSRTVLGTSRFQTRVPPSTPHDAIRRTLMGWAKMKETHQYEWEIHTE